MKSYTIRQLSDMGLISKRLKQVLVLLNCSTFDDMIALSKDRIKVDYIEKSHHLKDELYKAISDIDDLKEIIPEFAASVEPYKTPRKVKINSPKRKKFKVGDYTEELLKKSGKPISQHDLLQLIREHLPDTYIESIRANLNGDPQKRFVFFLDGYVGLRGEEYDSRFQIFSVENKKIQHAEQRIMEFLTFIEEKHRSPQPHGLDEEETLYRWYLDFIKSTSKEMAGLRATFQDYLKDYDEWVFTPIEYTYKRNCEQVKWFVDNNLELPTQDDEPELASWFNSQLENYTKHKDKRKKMFVDLMTFLSDYGMHFYDAKSAKGKKYLKETGKRRKNEPIEESALIKYSRLFSSMKNREDGDDYAAQKALLIIAIGNLIQKHKITSNEIALNDDLLMEFADVCIDNVGTASSYNIAIPYYHLMDEPFWNLIPKVWAVHEDIEDDTNSEPTYEYIERTYACSLIDHDLYELLSSEEDFASLKKILVDNLINCNDTTSSNTITEEVYLPKPREEKAPSIIKLTKGPQTNLRVVFEGETIVHEKAVATFMEIIRRIGFERVRGLGLKWCGIPLISMEEDDKYTQKYESGYYVNVNSSTDRKQKQLYDIAEAFNLSIQVDVIDDRGNVVIKEQRKRGRPRAEGAEKRQPTPADDSIIKRFLDFVRRDHNDRTARWYAFALQNQVREWITKIVGDNTDSIFGFNTLEEVDNCINKLKESIEFMEENRRKKNVMTAALNKYYLFLQSSYAKSRD